MNTARRRRAAYLFGHAAEWACIASLLLRGYRLLHRRHRSYAGEIDLIARRGRVIAFIEVKARLSQRAAQEALSPAQRTRILRAAELYLAKSPETACRDARFDLMLVSPWRLPVHLADAWRP